MSEAKPLVNGAGNKADAEFSEIVRESSERIQGSAPSPIPIKRKRGRPPKHVSEPYANESGTAAPAQVASQPSAPPLDISPYLEKPLIAVSKIPANRHRIPELALDKDEARACAESLNALMNAFVPNISEMSPKTAAIISAGATIGTIVFSKYQIYLDKRVVEPVEEMPPAEDYDPATGQVFPSEQVHAADAFRRRA